MTVLGSTGSIGCNTIDLIDRNRAAYEVVALTANGNAKALAGQALRLRPQLAVVADHGAYAELKELLAGSGIEVAAGSDAVIEAAARDSRLGDVRHCWRGRTGAYVGGHTARVRGRPCQQGNTGLRWRYRHGGGGKARRHAASGGQ